MNNSPVEIEKHFGHIASLIGERSRAIMLWNLLDGRAYTASELAIAADISFQSASNHLSRLLQAGILASVKQGRHKYYRFANDHVAEAIEHVAGLVPAGAPARSLNLSEVTGIKYARTCYDHLAGKVGVQLTQSMVKKRWLIPLENRYELSKVGYKQIESIGIDINAVQKQSRKFAYPCLDWSERTHHLGGAMAAAMLQNFLRQDWIRKVRHSRELMITGRGKIEMNGLFKTSL